MSRDPQLVGAVRVEDRGSSGRRRRHLPEVSQRSEGVGSSCDSMLRGLALGTSVYNSPWNRSWAPKEVAGESAWFGSQVETCATAQ